MERSIDVLKIDVEGAEMQVLQGARNTLVKNDRLVLLLDLHPKLGVDPAEVCGYLRDLGFSLFAEQPPFDRGITDCGPLRSLVAMRSASIAGEAEAGSGASIG